VLAVPVRVAIPLPLKEARKVLGGDSTRQVVGRRFPFLLS